MNENPIKFPSKMNTRNIDTIEDNPRLTGFSVLTPYVKVQILSWLVNWQLSESTNIRAKIESACKESKYLLVFIIYKFRI